MQPIDFFWRAAERWPQRIAIDAPGGCIRYDALARKVAALAAGLQALEPAVQSRVGICAGNSADHIAALLAVMASGKVWVPLNPKSTQSEVRRIIDATEPSIVLCDAGGAALVQGAPGIHLVLGEGTAALEQAQTGALPVMPDLPADAIQAIKFTGGTTGLPKGVMQPCRAWMAGIANQIQAWGSMSMTATSWPRPSRMARPPTCCPSWRRAAAMCCWMVRVPRPCAAPLPCAAALCASCRPP